jgi:hypothetical protein
MDSIKRWEILQDIKILCEKHGIMAITAVQGDVKNAPNWRFDEMNIFFTDGRLSSKALMLSGGKDAKWPHSITIQTTKNRYKHVSKENL